MVYHVSMMLLLLWESYILIYAKITNGWARISFAVGLTKIGLGFVPIAACRFSYEKADDTSMGLNSKQSSHMKHKYFRML